MKNLKTTKMETPKKENNLAKSQTQLETKTRITELSKSIALAFERTGTQPKDISGMVNDISTEFPTIPIARILKAIRKGGLGYYGKTYGELSTQEICIWIINEGIHATGDDWPRGKNPPKGFQRIETEQSCVLKKIDPNKRRLS